VRGLSIKLAWSAVGKFVFYGSYAFLNGYYMSLISRGSAATVRDALIMGYLAEVLTVPCTLPFEAIATRLQTSKGTGAWGAISNIYNESGIKGFYKSLAAYWILNWQSAIVNTIFNQFKAWLLNFRTSKTLSTFDSFLLGAVSRCIGLCIMFPVIRVKTLLQAERKKVQKESSSPCISTNGPELKSQAEKHSTPTSLSSSASTSTPLTSKPSDEEPGVWSVLVQLYNSPAGLQALYRGLGPELLRGVISTAIVLSVKEQAFAAVSRTLSLLGRG